MAKNKSLNAAKAAKYDEFYTQYDVIQAELNHYEKDFEGKTVLCNCDDSFEIMSTAIPAALDGGSRLPKA